MSDLTNAIYQRGFSESGEDDPLRDFMATYFEHDDEVTRSQVIDFIDRIIRLTEPDAGEGTELHGLPEGLSTEPAVKERGVLVAPTHDTTAKAPERVALEEHGWYIADVVTGDHVESSEWLPVLRAAHIDTLTDCPDDRTW